MTDVATAQRTLDDARAALIAAGTVLAISVEDIADPVTRAALDRHTEATQAYEAAYKGFLDAQSIEHATLRSIAAIAREGTRS